MQPTLGTAMLQKLKETKPKKKKYSALVRLKNSFNCCRRPCSGPPTQAILSPPSGGADELGLPYNSCETSASN